MTTVPDLLIDQVYESCFSKKRARPALRAMLQSARRFVLDDGMSAFLADLTAQTFLLRHAHIKPHRKRRHYCRGIDVVRHFARLPHKVTWMEYSSPDFHNRMCEIVDGLAPDVRAVTPIIGNTNRTRVAGRTAFLCWQHDTIETAFCARPWMRRPDGESGSEPVALMWDTENGVLPWRQMSVPSDWKISPSEYVLMARGYVRDNVGFRNVSGELDTPQHKDNSPRMYEARQQMVCRMQILWAFLSTLNKIPVIGERKIERVHGFMARGRYRRFLEHSVISLNIPARADTRKIAEKITSELRRRAHLVRGHWRDDWHQPKGNKALWIAEHQRGDASLGFVTHDYAVTHEVAP